MSSVDLATRFKIGMYLLNRESVSNAFLRSTYIKQFLNDLPHDKDILRYHKIDLFLNNFVKILLRSIHHVC